jgi:chromosomal replication initiation ATPase DnaA
MRDVAAEFGATVEQMRGPQRRFVPARKEFCRRAWEFGRWSSVQIGRALNRDHTVVLRHVKGEV